MLKNGAKGVDIYIPAAVGGGEGCYIRASSARQMLLGLKCGVGMMMQVQVQRQCEDPAKKKSLIDLQLLTGVCCCGDFRPAGVCKRGGELGGGG